jgi:hypothetical protein
LAWYAIRRPTLSDAARDGSPGLFPPPMKVIIL